MNKIELLAPAGSMEALKAAIAGGADAVYLGLETYSARAFAANFTKEAFQEAIRLCHRHMVKVYVTMNTMLYETEIENAKETIDFLYNNDTDAILVQDLGLFHLIREMYPDFEIHISTQMHVHNVAGVKAMANFGASRIVLARETSIEEIRKACQTGVPIEVFAYGAICISYSGQCLFSQATQNRSANKGMCAQCCRMKYKDEKNRYLNDGKYALSPKDLNTINYIPQFIEAGVSSLKIEGRMKKAPYVYAVVRAFREAIEAYYANQTYRLNKEDEKTLKTLFNRGFSKGHAFHGDIDDRMSHYRPNHQGVSVGNVINSYRGKVTVKLSDTLHQHDGLRILNDKEDIGILATTIEKNGKYVNAAYKGDIVTLTCPVHAGIVKNQPVLKTTDTFLANKIDNEIQANFPSVKIKMHYIAKIHQPFILIIDDEKGNKITYQSDFILESAKSAPLKHENLVAQLSKVTSFGYEVTSITGDAENIFVPIKKLNEARREAIQRFDDTRCTFHNRIGRHDYTYRMQDKGLRDDRILVIDRVKQSHDDHVRILDERVDVAGVIDEHADSFQTYTNMVLSHVGNFYGKHDRCIAGMTLNIANSYALAFVLGMEGIDAAIVSSECNDLQLTQMITAFEKRYGFTPMTYRFVLGNRTLMYIKDAFTNQPVHSLYDMNNHTYQVNRKEAYTEINQLKSEQFTSTIAKGAYIIVQSYIKDLKEMERKIYEEIFQ